MTAADALEQLAAAGVTLDVEPDGAIVARPRTAITDPMRAAIRQHKEQLAAVLRLRAVHRSMGFNEDDVMFIERALLSGHVSEIRIVVGATALRGQ